MHLSLVSMKATGMQYLFSGLCVLSLFSQSAVHIKITAVMAGAPLLTVSVEKFSPLWSWSGHVICQACRWEYYRSVLQKLAPSLLPQHWMAFRDHKSCSPRPVSCCDNITGRFLSLCLLLFPDAKWGKIIDQINSALERYQPCIQENCSCHRRWGLASLFCLSLLGLEGKHWPCMGGVGIWQSNICNLTCCTYSSGGRTNVKKGKCYS